MYNTDICIWKNLGDQLRVFFSCHVFFYSITYEWILWNNNIKIFFVKLSITIDYILEKKSCILYFATQVEPSARLVLKLKIQY